MTRFSAFAQRAALPLVLFAGTSFGQQRSTQVASNNPPPAPAATAKPPAPAHRQAAKSVDPLCSRLKEDERHLLFAKASVTVIGDSNVIDFQREVDNDKAALMAKGVTCSP